MKKLNEKGTLQGLIILMIAILVIITVFLALWAPSAGSGTRQALFNLINDSNFTATYGTDIRDALVFLLDLTPLLMFLAGIAIMGVAVVGEIKAGSIKLA